MLRRAFPLGFVICLFLASLLFFNRLVPIAEPVLTKSDFETQARPTLTYVAIGDSLTEGVGDSTMQGGFVPILSQKITSQYGQNVDFYNYGKAGNTSKQILKRMRENPEIKKNLAQADFMTLTVGGNNVMSVVRKNLDKLSLSSFTQPVQVYQQQLRQILGLARRDNKDLPIYIVGIYNPFYLSFNELTEMQTVIDDWNKATQAVVSEYNGVYFVPVNDLLYKGLDGKQGLEVSEDDSPTDSETTSESEPSFFDAIFGSEEETDTDKQSTTASNESLNNLLSDDHFHPNNTGYLIMTNAIMEKILETKEEWKTD
ncbi:SGNH/GDSL hydrolase family protein [Streptococcus caprae]|uniref:SGNH/GDSL hydrolase family protein n=1 Tax=Streptococcus caprae TaxID=1640501 RepID=A0ABV8CTR7_9STRE